MCSGRSSCATRAIACREATFRVSGTISAAVLACAGSRFASSAHRLVVGHERVGTEGLCMTLGLSCSTAVPWWQV